MRWSDAKKGSLCSSLCSETLLFNGDGKEYQKRGRHQMGGMSNFCKGKKLSKNLKFHVTFTKSQSSFQVQFEECISLLFFVFLTIILKSRILTCRFFDFILVSKLLNLDFFEDIARFLV